MALRDLPIQRAEVSAYRIPTETPEADGTLAWSATTLVLVELEAGGVRGLGYTYAEAAAARLITDQMLPRLTGEEALDTPGIHANLLQALRNQGRAGLVSHALAAVDTALWDLKAKLLDLPLFRLLGRARRTVPVYGSGGFTNYTDAQLQRQLADWVESGIGQVKMKVGAEPDRDRVRVAAARQAIGDEAGLWVDANGAYTRKQALAMAERFAEQGVEWFEEPVSSDDLTGLRLLRDRGPPGMAISAGEYGYDPFYFRRMLEAQAVDVLQIDATRCGGITGFLTAAALARAHAIPISSHTAPALHLHLGGALEHFQHLEWFHDHVRIERMLFAGSCEPRQGELEPDGARLGLGLEFRRTEAERYRVY